MKKANKIFISILIVELILIGILYLFFQNPCGSACNNYSLLNPFGIGKIESCIQVCTQTLHPLIYLFSDLFIITLIIYLLFLLKMKGGKKNEK